MGYTNGNLGFGMGVRGDERSNIDLWDLSDLKDIRVFKVG